MKLLLVVLLLFATPALALDAEVSGALYSGNKLASFTGGEADYSAYLEIGHTVGRFRPYTAVETFMDSRDDLSFHPASVRYEVGLQVELFGGLYLDGSHSCWHPIDGGGRVEEYDKLQLRWVWGKND